MGLASVAFIRGIYWMEDVFDAIPGNYYTRHMLGMLLTGVMMYLLFRFAGQYYVQGVGYATIMDILTAALKDPWFLLLLMALKLLATFLSLGSGASGGVFSPALFVGATGGAAFAYLCNAAFPGMEAHVPTFAIAGMAAMIGGTTGAVLTGIIMISEMTRDYSVVLPLVITVSTAYATRKMIMVESVYTMKLMNRGHTVPEGLQAAVLTTKTVRDVMETDFAVAPLAGGHPPGGSVAVLESDGLVAGVSKQPQSQAEDGGDAPSPRRRWRSTTSSSTSARSCLPACAPWPRPRRTSFWCRGTPGRARRTTWSASSRRPPSSTCSRRRTSCCRPRLRTRKASA